MTQQDRQKNALSILKDAGSIEFDEWAGRLASQCQLDPATARQAIRDLVKGNPYITTIVKKKKVVYVHIEMLL